MTIRLARLYEPASPDGGTRILVDRLWPRGLAKSNAPFAHWMKDVAPSTALRRWFAHDPARYPEFARRYTAELDANARAVEPLRALCRKKPVTLVYAARDEVHNHACVLRQYLLGLPFTDARTATPKPPPRSATR